MASPYNFPNANNYMMDRTPRETSNYYKSDNQMNWEGLYVEMMDSFNNVPSSSMKWDGISLNTHPLDNLLDIAPSTIRNYYIDNPPHLTNDCMLNAPALHPMPSSIPDIVTNSPRTVPSVSNPAFEDNSANHKQNYPLNSSYSLKQLSCQSVNDGNDNSEDSNDEDKQSASVPPPALVFNIEKPKKKSSKPSEPINDENNLMINYYNQIMRNSKKKYRDMSPLSNIDGTEKYVEGITDIPDEIPEDQIEKFNEYSKLNFVCKKCSKTFPLLKASTYFNGGLCCIQCCSCIHRETIGLYDYMKDVYFENENLYKCDRIIHYRPLWQFLKFEKKKKTWKIAKLCIYCRNLKCWEYLNKPNKRRKTMQQLQNEKVKQLKQHNISSVINPDDHLVISQDDEINNSSNSKRSRCSDGDDDNVRKPPKKKSKKNNRKRSRKFKYDDDDYSDDDEDDKYEDDSEGYTF